MKKKVFSLMMTLVLAFMGVARAELVTFGSGTSTSGYCPIRTSSAYSLVETLITPEDITVYGDITSIAYYAEGACTRNLDIYIVPADPTLTVVTSDGWFPCTASDLVFSGNVNFVADNWTTIPLTTPYWYTGDQSFVIIVDDNTGTAMSNAVPFRVYAHSNLERSIRIDGTTNYNPQGMTASGTAMRNRNQMQFEIVPHGSGGGVPATLLVHDGTTTNGYVPVYGYYADAYNKTEMVYPAAELSAMNGGTINGMTFYASDANVSWGSASYQVFVSEVSDATISSFYGPGTVVYQGPLSIVNNEMVVNFTTPYTYNGGNLLVGVYQTTTGTYVSCTWYGETVNGASIHDYNYNGLSSITTGIQRNFLPKTNFAYTTAGGGGGSMEDMLHVKYMDGETEVIDTLNLGVRPAGAWMEPFQFTMYSEGPNYTVNILDFTPSDGMFSVEGEELPFLVRPGEDVELIMNVNTADTGVIERQFVAITEGNRAAHIWPVMVELYAPLCPDVWELACEEATEFPFVEVPQTAHNMELHNDYTLPFPEIPEGYDAVYKLVFENDVMLNASVTAGENGKVALYREGFEGEGGPMANNYYTGPSSNGGGASGGSFEAMIGDETSTTTSTYFPFHTLWNYSIGENLFLASELTEAGVTTAPMTSLSWYVSSTSCTTPQNGISIWMANVSDSELTATSHTTAGMTLVYTGADVLPVAGQWNEFEFNAGNFAWDGHSNVLVVCQRLNGDWQGSVSWQTHNPGFTAMAYDYDDYEVYDMTSQTYSMYTSATNRANIIFKANGRAVTRESIIDFEDGIFPPEGWTYYGSSESWYVDSEDFWGYAPAYAGSYSLYIDGNGNYDSDYLVSPAIEFNSSAASVSFAYATPDWSGDINDLSVVYGTSPTGPWTYTSFMYQSSNSWTTATVDLSSLNGTYYIAFESYDGYGYCTAIDNINIDVPTTPTPGPEPEPLPLGEMAYGPEIINAAVEAGTYYLVASSTDADLEVTINAEDMPCPVIEAEGFAFNPTPADDADEVEPGSVTLRWNIPAYATGWRLVFGSTYYPDPNHPQTIMYPEDGSFATELANSYTVRNLWNNTNYFWHVEFNNDGCPEGVSSPIWGFTTHLNIPTNLTAVDYTVFDDENIVLNWNAVVDRTYRYYFIYRDGVKIGETTVNQINLTTYTDGPLPYNMDGYTYYVTAVYDEGESAPSDPVTVKVSGRGNVNGHVYEQDGTTGIAGATVTMVGQDEFGVNHTYNFTTNAQGYYSGAVYAGPGYDGQAAKDGYQTAYVPVQGEPIVINYNETTSPIDYILDENFDPVCGVIAEYYPDSLDPNSPYVKVYWGCGLPGSEIIEPFETGDFSLFDWQIDPTYPWSITTTNPYEGTYCMKSGGAGVNNVISNMTVTVNIPADGLMSFFGKISCESSWDYGYFYIDGVQKGSYTGAGNWAEKTFDVTAGDHTFQWRYTKDGSVNSNDDCFYVDYITFYKQPAPPVPGMTYDFEDGTMQGWTSVDADGDGYGWYMGSEIMTGQTGNGGSTDFVLSQSYYMGTILYPDNYLVSPQVQLGGIVRFYACAQDASYAAEHFGLAVSTTNTNPSSFTMVQEWTMTAKSAGEPGKPIKGQRSGREQGNWYEYTVDLSAYSGMGYVAIRHFNCSDMFYLNVDDITIGEPAKGVAETRSLDHYRVYRTNCYNDGPYTEENTVLLATVWVPDTVYIDVEWADLPAGIYKWGVGAVYSGNRGEEIEGPINWAAPVAVNTNRSFSTNSVAKTGPKVNAAVVEENQDRYRNYLQYCTETFSGGVGTGGGAVYWGIRFPAADLAAYAGQTLTKVGVFMDIDGDYGWTYSGNYTASVYQGGATAPGTLVSTATEYLPGDMAWHDITLTTPVTIDATQDLWLCFYTPDIAYPMAGCDYVGNANSDFLSLDGTVWEHAGDYSLNYTWMIRGMVENGGGPGPGPAPTPGTNLNQLALPRESETIWSNCLDKDMYIIGENQDGVTVNVLLNSADSPEGVQVTFTNYNEAEQEMYPIEPIVLDETGFYAFDSFRKGEYKVNVTFDGYEPIEDSVSIWEPTDLRYVMTEIIYGVSDLYVSSTGWAMWGAEGMPTPGGGGQGGNGDTFSDDFESGLGNWTLVDADADGHNWYHSSMSQTYSCYDYTGWGHNGTNGFAVSQSYTDCTYDSYDPNNFMITNQKYSISASSTLNFWADYGNDSYPDHFGVAVATVDNPTPADFTIVWEGTAKAGNAGKTQVRHDGERYQNWRSHSVNLGAYAGQDVYIAFRHFNSYDQYEIYIDDVELTNGAKDGDRHLEYFKVMCTSIDGEPIFNADTEHPFCQVATDELVEGEHYIAKVAAVYSTGMSAWTECEWQYIACDNYAGTVNGVTIEGNEISWEYPAGGGGGGGGGGQGSTFSENFDAGMPAGWTTVDADGDGYTWVSSMTPGNYHNAGVDLTGTGHNASAHYVISGSWANGPGIVLYPDNYLVSPQVTLAAGSTFSFWACAQDASYPADHFGVFISDNGTSNWTMVNEWTMTAKGSGVKTYGRGGNNRVQGNWYNYSVDLSTFAGQKYIAIRHFNCSDQFILNVDDIELTAGAKSNRNPWDLMMTFNAAEAAQYGVAYDGNNFYTSNWGYSSATHNFFKYDLQGNMLEGFEIAGCGTLRGMTYDGQYTYGVANSNTVYCIDLAAHNLVSTFTTSYGAMRGITYDPERDGFWVIGNWSGNLTLIDRQGTILQTGPAPESASDLAYYKDENDVEHVFCFNNGTNDVNDWVIGNTSMGGSVFNFSAVPGFNAGTSGGCTVASFNNKIAFIGDIQQDPNLIGIYELRDDTNPGPGPGPQPSGDILGAMIFVDGEWEAFVEAPTNTYTYEGDGNEVCVRMVYNGTNNLPEGNIYFSMSCPECEEFNPAAACEPGAPIHAELLNATDQVRIWWGEQPLPPAPPMEEWLYYDDGTYATSVGAGGTLYWGTMFPAASLAPYAGTSLTKVAVHTSYACSATLNVYVGGAQPGGSPVATKNFTMAGDQQFMEVTLDAPVAIDGTQNLWITFYQTGETYPADACADTGDANNRWVSVDGASWMDLSTAGLPGYGWMIRGFVTNQAKGGELVSLPEFKGNVGGELSHTEVVSKPADLSFMHRAEIVKYNVYRSTSATGDYTLIGEVTEESAPNYYEYIDTPATAGTYYYQVTAVYDNECESEPAAAYDDPSVNYVSASVDAVGENNGNVALYPNPTKGNVTIEAAGMSRITVVSVLGQVVYDTELDADTYTLNMAQFNAGMYMVRVYTEEGVTVKRVTVMQ